jgi:hypothetical protein
MPSQYLSTVKPRSEIIAPSETVTLKALFRGPDGNPADLDSFPTVTIVQPSGNVVLGPTSAGCYKLGVGIYGFDYQVGLQPLLGMYTDVWQGAINGNYVGGSFNFMVHITGQNAFLNTDGYEHLGDIVPYNYNQIEIHNINKLLKLLKNRLNSSGKKVSKDSFGNKVYVDCDVFNLYQLIDFLNYSLLNFNGIPHFTHFDWNDSEFFNVWGSFIVQGAFLHAMGAISILERARASQISDNGISYTPADIADILQSQYTTEYQYWQDNVKMIKANMKPNALGLGTFGPLGGNRTVYRNLANMRARRLI